MSRTEIILVQQLGQSRYNALHRHGAELSLDDVIEALN
jgi:hypothetical protein